MRALLLSAAAALILAATMFHKPLGPAPVVVELFTSQGCSSCPPAEALFREMAHDPSLRGKVIPLAFHVDYWDRLGWRDPFSSADWTRRQQFYTRALRLDGAYTPQAVVNGSRQLVGSSSTGLRAAIDEASRQSAAGSVRIDASRNGATVTATIHANAPPGTDIMLALFENDVTTHIGGGENSGLTDTEDAIVRRLLRVDPGTVTLPVDRSWKHLGVAVFLQDHATLAIRNAAVAYVETPPAGSR